MSGSGQHTPLESRLEDGVLPPGCFADEGHIQLSIAISLKRIADALDYGTRWNGQVEASPEDDRDPYEQAGNLVP